MKRTLTYPISKKQENITIEKYLKNLGYSKHLLITLKKSPEGITIDSVRVYTTRVLKKGETLTIQIPDDHSQNIFPTPMPLAIVYEDEDLLVINKSANLPIHPSQGNFDNTLANGLAWYFKEQGLSFTYRAVNRLDRDTSGLLIVAKNLLSSAILSGMVKQKEVHREYAALVSGYAPDAGTINAPIGRVDGSTIERRVDFEKGEHACTHYQRLFYYPDFDCSLLSVKLETGRTHQIRVHMSHIGHPILADFLYHPDYRFLNRQALHSHRLSFYHPVTGCHLSFTAPLPEDWQAILHDQKTVCTTPSAADLS